MSKALRVSTMLLTLVFGASCQTTQQTLAATQPTAMDTALRRARFDLDCPTAKGVLLSDDLIQPAVRGPWVAGIERLEYTIGVEGCDKRTTVVVMCQAGSTTCFAANPNREYQNNGYVHP
jgi:hypothetical protein